MCGKKVSKIFSNLSTVSVFNCVYAILIVAEIQYMFIFCFVQFFPRNGSIVDSDVFWIVSGTIVFVSILQYIKSFSISWRRD